MDSKGLNNRKKYENDMPEIDGPGLIVVIIGILMLFNNYDKMGSIIVISIGVVRILHVAGLLRVGR